MQIKWLGHSAFLMTSSAGVRIVTDPYEPGGYNGAISHGAFGEPVDVLLMSHEHPDHGYAGFVTGSPIVIRGAGDFKAADVEFKGLATFHDASGGRERGKNTVFTFIVDGVKTCHLGDLGHVLTSEQAAEIGAVDVLLAPIGGFFTIGAKEAWKVAEQLAAKIVIPMHYKTDKVAFPIAPVDEFIKDKPNVQRMDTSEIEVTPESLPRDRQIIVLQYAL